MRPQFQILTQELITVGVKALGKNFTFLFFLLCFLVRYSLVNWLPWQQAMVFTQVFNLKRWIIHYFKSNKVWSNSAEPGEAF